MIYIKSMPVSFLEQHTIFLLNKDDAEDIVQEVFIKYFISNKHLTMMIMKKAGFLQ